MKEELLHDRLRTPRSELFWYQIAWEEIWVEWRHAVMAQVFHETLTEPTR